MKDTNTQREKQSKNRKAKIGARKRESDCTIYAALIIGVIQFFIMPIMNGGRKKQSTANYNKFSDCSSTHHFFSFFLKIGREEVRAGENFCAVLNSIQNRRRL